MHGQAAEGSAEVKNEGIQQSRTDGEIWRSLVRHPCAGTVYAYAQSLRFRRSTQRDTHFDGRVEVCKFARCAIKGLGATRTVMLTVRHVIIYGAPSDIETLYQEMGRAGRDGLPARCTVFYGLQDFIINKKHLRDMNRICNTNSPDMCPASVAPAQKLPEGRSKAESIRLSATPATTSSCRPPASKLQSKKSAPNPPISNKRLFSNTICAAP